MGVLSETRRLFRDGELCKPDYIDQMYHAHSLLFEYAELLPETDIEKIEIVDGKVRMSSRRHGITLVCDPRDKRTAPIETLNFDCYEPEESGALFRLLSDGMTVLDIGANIGWYSMVISKTFPSSNVYAFEPIPGIYQTLSENIALNRLPNIHPFNMGLSDQAGVSTFYFAPDMGVNASMRNVAGREPSELLEVSCTLDTVDRFSQEHRLVVDFIKCDVEGAEYLVFKGARQTLERDRPILFSELLRKWSARFDYHPNHMLRYLQELGYNCYCPKNHQLRPFFEMDEHTVETNFLFLHQDKHQRLIEQYAEPVTSSR